MWRHPMRFKMWRAVNSRLAGFYQYFNLIFGSAAFQSITPSDTMQQRALTLFRLLESRKCSNSDLSESLAHSHDIIKECTELETLLLSINNDGYNILQVAVINNDKNFIEVLVSEGADLNQGICTLPLHLACFIGDLPLVRFLLQLGANHHIEIGMCYPAKHIPVHHVPSRFHFLETDIFACDRDHQLPVMYAIQQDNLEVVRFFMENTDSLIHYQYHRLPLHMAARYGAVRSLEYLVNTHPDDINEVDEEGMTPLHHAVKWGRELVQFLIEAGADIHARNDRHQTALHLLYSNAQSPHFLYSTTKFLLGSGLEQEINSLDYSSNTPLHIIVTQVNRLVASFPASCDMPQNEYDASILDTIQLLLSYNCDPNVMSNNGVSAMHKLMLQCDFVMSNDPTGITLETLPVREMYKTDFDVLHNTLQLFLKHGTLPNSLTGAGRSSLVILLQSTLSVDVQCLKSLLALDGGFLRCVSLMCKSGAMPSMLTTTHLSVICSMTRFCQRCLSQRNQQVRDVMGEFFKSLLSLLLKHGLNSNYCSKERQRDIAGSSGNLLIELVGLAQYIRQPSDLDYLHDWVLTALKWGANPDVEPYPSESIICHSQSSIFLKPKATQPFNRYMYEIQDVQQIFEGGHAVKLLMLFYNSMDHEPLYHCMHSAKFMSRFDPNRSPSVKFIRMVNSFSSRPRSLRQISRVAIYKAINRDLMHKITQLPLPPLLKKYLSDIEH